MPVKIDVVLFRQFDNKLEFRTGLSVYMYKIFYYYLIVIIKIIKNYICIQVESLLGGHLLSGQPLIGVRHRAISHTPTVFQLTLSDRSCVKPTRQDHNGKCSLGIH